MRTQLRLKAAAGHRVTCRTSPLPIEMGWFEDENFFRLTPHEHAQNRRIWLPKGKTKKRYLKEDATKGMLVKQTSQSDQMPGIMVAIAVNLQYGLTDPFCCPKDLKINAVTYQNMLRDHLLPQCLAWSGPGFWWQHDNAPAHSAKSTKVFVSEIKRDFNVETLDWPPQSPDLQPLDYSIWKLISDRIGVTSNRLELLAMIKSAVREINLEWEEHRQRILTWPKRLRRCAAADGLHFESS